MSRRVLPVLARRPDGAYRPVWSACLLALALTAAGCTTTGLSPSAIPNLPPVDQPAAVVPAGTFAVAPPAGAGTAPATAPATAPVPQTVPQTTAPTAPAIAPAVAPPTVPQTVPQTAPTVAQAVPHQTATPGVQAGTPAMPPAITPAVHTPAPVTTTVPATGTPAGAVGKGSPQDQRIAALELSLLNMANELAWLKSQPANPTTPWGTPSPRVVPQPDVQPAPATASASEPARKPATKAEREQAERISAIERNMQAIRDELATLGRTEQGTTPWGTPAPNLSGDLNAATGGAHAANAQTAAATPPRPAQPVQAAQQTQPVQTMPHTTQPVQTAQPVQTPVQPVPAQTAPHTAPATVPVQPTTPTAGYVQPTQQAQPYRPAQPTQPVAPAPTAPARQTPVLTHAQIMAQTGSTSVPQQQQPQQYVPQPTQPVQQQYVPQQPAQQQPAQQQPQQYVPQQPVQQQAQQHVPQPTRPNAFQPVPGQASGAVQPTAPAAQSAGGEQGMYQQALREYDARRLDSAWRGFDAYLAAYPNGRFAPNALYWKGEVRYTQGDYPGAILLFKDVLTRFAQHQKAPDALLKIVLSYKRLNDTDNAALHLRILNEDYPQAPATRRAREMKL